LAAGVAPVFELGDGDASRAGSIEVWFDGALALARERATILEWRRTPSAIRSAPFDGVLLQVFGGGGRLDLPPSDVSEFESGDIVVLDMNRPFRVRAEGASELVHVGLWIPTSRLPEGTAAGGLQGLRLAVASSAGAMLGASLRALVERVGAISETDFSLLTGGVADLAGRILSRKARYAEPGDPAMQLETFVTVRRFVERNLTSPKLGPLMVARNFGLSRASAYRLFEPVGGLGKFIRTQRLQRAYAEITAPPLADRRIGEIAYALGFQSFSAFSRLFSKTYGMTPMEARKAALSGLAAKPTARRADHPSSNLFTVLGRLK
jgi:AraC-like DNA-binding protein